MIGIEPNIHRLELKRIESMMESRNRWTHIDTWWLLAMIGLFAGTALLCGHILLKAAHP